MTSLLLLDSCCSSLAAIDGSFQRAESAFCVNIERCVIAAECSGIM